MILPGTQFSFDTVEWSEGPWWKRAAVHAINLGHYEPIKGRHDCGLYLLRCWISEPIKQADGKWDSQNSTMLHYFARPDDDGALHSHPWSFTSEVLSGYYEEAIPGENWIDDCGGPEIDERHRLREVGSVRRYNATDLHAVTEIGHDTWTKIVTGPRVRDWDFFPPGETHPIQWQKFLGIS